MPAEEISTTLASSEVIRPKRETCDHVSRRPVWFKARVCPRQDAGIDVCTTSLSQGDVPIRLTINSFLAGDLIIKLAVSTPDV